MGDEPGHQVRWELGPPNAGLTAWLIRSGMVSRHKGDATNTMLSGISVAHNNWADRHDLKHASGMLMNLLEEPAEVIKEVVGVSGEL